MIKGIQKIFSEVADSYEFVNHILTLGLDIHWRRKAAREAAKGDGLYWLDVCSGTGEMAQNLSQLADKNVKIISVDFCHSMLARLKDKNKKDNLLLVEAEAKLLPFSDDTFDLITISFATRNISPNPEYLIAHLKEFRRVLKSGGHFMNLETSQPRLKLVRKLFHFYIKLAVKPIGSLISGSKTGYNYLSYTIPRFFSAQDFSSLLSQEQFVEVKCRRFFFGICALHVAKK